MYILGLSSYYHDSAAVLLKNGVTVCAAEEERFTRIKHDNSFPINAAKFCLNYAKINVSEVDDIAYYEKPLLKFERILETFVETYPKSMYTFAKSIPEWLDVKIKIEKTIRDTLEYKGKIFFVPHHLSHAAAAFLPSGFDSASILTIDGVGDYPTTGLWQGTGTNITQLKSLNFPNSLGLFYSTFTSFLGFRVNNDEYKVMGLSAYGTPKFYKKVKNLIDIKDDGSFKLDMDYFSYRESFRMWSDHFERAFGKPREYEDKISSRDRDLAASLQLVTEEVYFKVLNHLYTITGNKNLCIGGGVALNSLANGMIYKKTPFEKVSILGVAGDSGAALGAAIFTHNVIFANRKRHIIKDLYLGGSFGNTVIRKELEKRNLKFEKVKNSSELIGKTAAFLRDNKIVGWYQGRMEFGPRALGTRSILANPEKRKMKDLVNNIKKRELFRPFAGSVLQEKVSELFEVPEKDHYSPFMNFCFKVKKAKRKLISAIVHEDGTCRIQTVNYDNGPYYELIKKFYTLTGIPCILNTSFNVASEPIVNTPSEAIVDFLENPIDYLVIGDFIVSNNFSSN